MYIQRIIEKDIMFSINNFPVTAITGPRQCGKSTLARNMDYEGKQLEYLDLERPSDLQKLDDPEWFFKTMRDSLICIDEIQRKPELFPVIRSLTDEWNENGKFLILGSASGELSKQNSETLAGRIAYNRMFPFLFEELKDNYTIEILIERGTFPKSILAKSDAVSVRWKENFILTFLERDLQIWAGASPITMRRLWQMLAHYNGQTVNYSSLGNSLSVSNVTIRNYIDILENTYMIHVLPPFIQNTGKRIIKAPKVYIADSGITLSLLGLKNFNQLTGHPALGSVWEQVIISNLKGAFPSAEFYYYRTAGGAEIDIVLKINQVILAIECKATLSPTISKGFYSAITDINPDHSFIAIPANKGYPVNKSIDIVSVHELIRWIREYMSSNK